MQPDRERMERHWNTLCRDIGERLAGTQSEARAAAYIREEFSRAGCAHATVEPFPCRSRVGATAAVQVWDSDHWHRVEAEVVTGASSTAGTIEGEPIWLEMPEQVDLLEPGSLSGRILVMFGPLPEVVDHHIRLVAANPAAVIHVDHRLPFSWAKADGTFPLWVAQHGFPPVVTIPFKDAWKWRRGGSVAVRVTSSIEMKDADSTNVVADLPGEGPGTILIGAHHDTQAGNVGADDNASGVVALIELAHLLGPVPRRRTIRFVSFGTEEQLSVGSAAYVLAHRRELDAIDLMVNFDSIASPLGHHRVVCPGMPTLVDYGVDALRRFGLRAASLRATIPFSDHFPFTVYGVPALWLYRENFPGGRWQHHSIHDNLDNISVDVAAVPIAAVAGLVAEVAAMAEIPFQRGVDPSLAEQTATYARDLYGLDPSA